MSRTSGADQVKGHDKLRKLTEIPTTELENSRRLIQVREPELSILKLSLESEE